MSLATLARKSKTTNPRFRRDPCFVLNMTGRGHVIGGKFNAAPCRSKGKRPSFGGCSAGGNTTCCSANHTTPKDCKKGCGCWHGGLSQPAPQMSYGNYLNRKSKGAYRPGGQQCCETSNNLTANKIVWQQSPNISAGEIIQQKKDTTIACYNNLNDNSSLTGRCATAGCGNGLTKYTELYKYEINVGTEGGGGGIGFASGKFGSICPGLWLNNVILAFFFGSDNNMHFGFLDAGTPFTKCSIKSITVTDRLDNSSRTYLSNNSNFEHNYLWTWTGNSSDRAWWSSKVGKCIIGTIEVEKTKKDVSCSTKKNYLHSTDLVRYTRINHNFCNTTKKLPYNTAGDLITRRRAANMCPKFGVMGFKKPINIHRCKK